MTTSHKSLRHLAFRMGAWTVGSSIVSQAIRLGSNLIMTRLLVPEMFGIMALATVLLIGLQLFSDIGLRQNIIQSHRGDDPAFLNTAWTVQIVRGAMIWVLAFLLAVLLYVLGMLHWLPAENVYAEPILPYILGVLSFNALISGFESTKVSVSSRNLSVGRITLIDLASQIVGVVFMLVWVYFDRSIWALVVGSLLSGLLRVCLSHTVLPGMPNRLHWEPGAVHEILHFGKWVFLSSILGFLAANGDRLILAALTDAKALGFYAVAFMISNTIRDVIIRLTNSVAFPTLSKVARERPNTLINVYYKFRLPIDIATLFAVGFLFASGHLLIEFLYDDRYHAAGPMLEILCIVLFEARYDLFSQCLMALGKPKVLTPLISIRLLVIYGILPLVLWKYGLNSALWIIGGSSLFALPLVFYLKIRYRLFNLWNELRVLPVLVVGYFVGLMLNSAISVF